MCIRNDHLPYSMAEQSAEGAGGASSSFIRELEIKDKTIRIKQLYVGDVGCVVWDAAIVLCKFLVNEYYFPVPDANVGGSDTQISKPESMSDPSYWNGKRVIDLGSGTGVVGIVGGVLGWEQLHIICDDLGNDFMFSQRWLLRTIVCVNLNSMSMA